MALMYLAVIAVECDKCLEIVDSDTGGQLIAVGLQIGPMGQSSSCVTLKTIERGNCKFPF